MTTYQTLESETAYGRALKSFVELLNEEPDEDKALDHATDMDMTGA